MNGVYFEGKPELASCCFEKIRNQSVTVDAPKRAMSSYHSLCNKVTNCFSNPFNFL